MWRLLAAIPVLLGCFAGGAAAQVQPGTIFASGAGLSMTVDTRQMEGLGYQPLRFTFQPIVAASADRTVTVEFLLRRSITRDHDLRVVQEIEIPAGSGPVSTTLSVPQCAGWMYSINVLIDGTKAQRLSVPWTGFPGGMRLLPECLPMILLVADNPPDSGPLANALQADVQQYSQFRPLQGSLPSSSGGPPYPAMVVLRGDELAERWIDYSGLDIACLSLDRLADLATKHPAAFRALIDWAAAGGNVWVYGVGQDWQRLGELEKLLGMSPRSDGGGSPTQRGWAEPDKAQYGRSMYNLQASEQRIRQDYIDANGQRVVVYVDNNGSTTTPDQPVPKTAADLGARPQESPEQAPFLLCPFDQGLIVALASENPFPGKQEDWSWLFGAMGRDRCLWQRRHGISMVSQNPDYWNFLIPGVGLVPVTTFCVLITLFVLAIGPLNYWLLRRWKRLHLLVLTIPASAAVVTLVLFGHALVTDGLGTRVRVRSVTQLDQRRGQAVCWSRLSYYCGLAPSRGLSFPTDVAVLPLEEIPSRGWRYQGPRQELIWGEQQHLTSGWLASRTPMQYMTVRSRPSEAGLQWIGAADGAAGPKVKNSLGTTVRQLLVCSPEGKYYWAADVAADTTVALEPVEPADAQRRLRRICSENAPTAPTALATRQNAGGIFGLRYYSRPYFGNRPVFPTLASSRLEKSLEVLTQGTPGGAPLLPRRTYVAVVDHSPEVVVGTPSAREEASFHVVFGRW